MSRKIGLTALPALLIVLLVPLSAVGDAIVVSRAMRASTIAEIFLDEGEIRVELDVGADDLEAFRNLLVDEAYEHLGHPPKPLAERLGTFFSEDWVIQPDDGPPLRGRVVEATVGRRLQRDEITGEPLAVQPDDAEPVLSVVILYALEERPATLSFSPPTGEDGRRVVSDVGFVLYHQGLPVNDFRYLPAGSTVDLDWNDPWYSRFRHRNLWRQYDAPLSVFLYAEPFEIRKEIVLRPKDLQHWVDLGLEGKETIPVEDQEALKARVAEFLAQRSPLSVDGRPRPSTLDRIHFIRRSLRTTGVIDPPEELDVNEATLGVIFVAPIEGLPKEARLTWDLFSPRIQSIPSAATDETGGLPFTLTPEDPDLVWINYLTHPTVAAMLSVARPQPAKISLPVLSGFCFAAVLFLLVLGVRRLKSGQGFSRMIAAAGAASALLGVLALPYARAELTRPFATKPAMAPQEAREVLHALLVNVYRSFDRRDEGLVYDRLALSISGDLLTEVYLQIRRSMELENQGGARVKIEDVEILDVSESADAPALGLAYRCRWNAAGSVGHWGHIHRRINQYDAVIAIEPVDDAWKISAIDMREEQRIDPNTPR